MATRTMYDSTDVAAIPAAATMVAGYTDGRYRTYDALAARFPTATLLAITVTRNPPFEHPHLDADVIDRETGDFDAHAAAAWAKQKHDLGQYPVIYVNRASWAQAITWVQAGRLNPRTQVGWWVADWTGKPHRPVTHAGGISLPIRALACQYADPATSGGHYDISAVYGRWPGVDPVPLSARHRRWARRLTTGWEHRRAPAPAADARLLEQLAAAATTLADRPRR